MRQGRVSGHSPVSVAQGCFRDTYMQESAEEPDDFGEVWAACLEIIVFAHWESETKGGGRDHDDEFTHDVLGGCFGRGDAIIFLVGGRCCA